MVFWGFLFRVCFVWGFLLLFCFLTHTLEQAITYGSVGERGFESRKGAETLPVKQIISSANHKKPQIYSGD